MSGAMGELARPFQQRVKLAVGLICSQRVSARGRCPQAIEQRHHLEQVLMGKQEVSPRATSVCGENEPSGVEPSNRSAVGVERLRNPLLVGDQAPLGAHLAKLDYRRRCSSRSGHGSQGTPAVPESATRSRGLRKCLSPPQPIATLPILVRPDFPDSDVQEAADCQPRGDRPPD